MKSFFAQVTILVLIAGCGSHAGKGLTAQQDLLESECEAAHQEVLDRPKEGSSEAEEAAEHARITERCDVGFAAIKAQAEEEKRKAQKKIAEEN